MKKSALLFSLISLLLFSCEVSSEESSVPIDTVGAAMDTVAPPATGETGTGVSVDYFKNLPSLPASEADIPALLSSSGKWIVADFKVANLDHTVLPSSVTAEAIHEQPLYALKDFTMVIHSDKTVELKKSLVLECPRRVFQINKIKTHPVLTILCEENQSEVNFEIYGVNEYFLYLKENKGLYPFDVYYVMRKE